MKFHRDQLMNILSIHTMEKAMEGRGGDGGLSVDTWSHSWLHHLFFPQLTAKQETLCHGLFFYIQHHHRSAESWHFRPTWSLRHSLIQIYHIFRCRNSNPGGRVSHTRSHCFQEIILWRSPNSRGLPIGEEEDDQEGKDDGLGEEGREKEL